MERVNYNHLFYFYITAKEGSIKEASSKLFVTQPTISDQLKLLEEYFECKLFSRKNRGLSLTREGELALDYCEQIFSMGQELTTVLRRKLKNQRKSIDIGISPHMAQYFLYDKIEVLFDQANFSVNIIEKERHYLIADLQEENIDLVFTDDNSDLDSNIDAFRIGVNRTYAVAHKKFKPTTFSFPKGLNDIPFFNYTQESSLKYEIDLFLRKNKINPKVIGSGNDINLLRHVTESARAFTIVPEVAMRRFKTIKKIVVLGELEELQTSVWGLIKSDNKGLAYELLRDNSK
jgi:LysR family transcriptional activator of nhaA